jgi:hypothetical protein
VASLRTRLQRLLEAHASVLLGIGVLVVAYGTLFPADLVVAPGGGGSDKLYHLVGFGGLTALLWIRLKTAGLQGRTLDVAALTLGVGAGIGVELLQWWLPTGRSAEVGDVAADALGSLLAVILLRLARFDAPSPTPSPPRPRPESG